MEMIKQHPALYQGLGGSFDLYVGVVKETPRFFQDNGLHWLYRALQQPYRIKRHKALFKFLYKLYLTNEY
jgi:UDP-N-acetyl-D-mannosaminouronate:lipid I N-acetyl-D-mannosaminouronosyltransferase